MGEDGLGLRTVTRTLDPFRPPNLPVPCLAAVSRPHSRTPWSAGVRSSAAVTVPASEHAGNGGRTGPNFCRGRSPASCRRTSSRMHTDAALSQARAGPRGGISVSRHALVPARPLQSEDSGPFCVCLCLKPETDSIPDLRGLERPARRQNTTRLLGEI